MRNLSSFVLFWTFINLIHFLIMSFHWRLKNVIFWQVYFHYCDELEIHPTNFYSLIFIYLRYVSFLWKETFTLLFHDFNWILFMFFLNLYFLQYFATNFENDTHTYLNYLLMQIYPNFMFNTYFLFGRKILL